MATQLTPGQKAMLDKVRAAKEAVEGELGVLMDALEELQACAENAEEGTSLNDLDGEADASGIETELYYLEEALEKFERAFKRYAKECDEVQE